MPAKKKTPAKKAAKKKAGATKKAVVKKKVAKKKAAKKSAKKAATKKAVKKAVSQMIGVKKKLPQKAPEAAPLAIKEPISAPPPIPVEEKPVKKEKQGIPCTHCDGTGVCAAGSPYDKSHGQMFGAKVRLTSCQECLAAAGEHSNSKKLVNCRICDGDGEI